MPAHPVTEVSLELIDASNWRDALEVRVADDQLAFVADYQPVALVILAKCFVGPGGRRWEPLLVRDKQRDVVGVLALTHGANDCELRNFAIDVGRQGKGLGVAAVRAVLGRVHQLESDCRNVTVSAHPDNHVAYRVYQAAGFVRAEEDRAGEPVWNYTID